MVSIGICEDGSVVDVTWFELLARDGGYGFYELAHILKRYIDECEESGEGIDGDYFVQVTLEHDW